MTQQFKFGDRVQDADGKQFVFLRGFLSSCTVAGDDGRTYDYPTNQLQPIPHPDTVRLDWLIETCRGIDNNADTTYLDGTPFPQYSVINSGTDRAANWYGVENGDHDDPRQAIDNAMKAEQQE